MSEPTKEELLFGRIALLNKLINEDQLTDALTFRRRRSDVNHDLGRVLKAKGYLDDKQYRSIRKAQEKALVGKGHSAEAAKYLARGMNADGSAPDGGEPRAPTNTFEKAAVSVDPPSFDPDLGDDEEEDEDEGVVDDDPAVGHVGGEWEKKTVIGEGVDARPWKRYKRPVDPKARQTMAALLTKARDSGASDLHMPCGGKPWFRLHGGIHFLNMPAITPKAGAAYAASIMSDESWEVFKNELDWDGSVDLGAGGRFRANVLNTRHGVSAVYRVINTKIPTLEQLGLPSDFDRFTTFHQGLVLVTGSTGSGKSSTLAAMIELVNKNRKDHIITMEDPIEFVYVGKGCNVTQRQIEEHTRSWGNALRASLREDPDVILIGEMRDLDTVQLAITAAETGHLVFGTLHTTSATRTIDRLLDVFPPGEQSQIRAMVSESLKGVISQQLVPTADGKGRVCAYEVLCWTPAVANLIREATTYKLISVLQTGKRLGMILMDDCLKMLLKQGKITKEAARAAAANPKSFQ